MIRIFTQLRVSGPKHCADAGCCPSGCMRTVQPILAQLSAPLCMHRSAATKEDLYPSWSCVASQSVEKRGSAYLAHAQPACRTSTSRDSRLFCATHGFFLLVRRSSRRLALSFRACTPQLPAARYTRGTSSHRPLLRSPSSRLPHKFM
jgi:hypothetical protein